MATKRTPGSRGKTAKAASKTRSASKAVNEAKRGPNTRRANATAKAKVEAAQAAKRGGNAAKSQTRTSPKRRGKAKAAEKRAPQRTAPEPESYDPLQARFYFARETTHKVRFETDSDEETETLETVYLPKSWLGDDIPDSILVTYEPEFDSGEDDGEGESEEEPEDDGEEPQGDDLDDFEDT